jgi:hypothetical protein
MKDIRPVVFFIGPHDKNVPKELRPDRRRRFKDRRQLYTYVADDRRSGIADRRKRQ